MKEKVTTFFKKNYHSIVMGVMIGIYALEVYSKRDSKEVLDLITDRVITVIWIFNWWVVIQFNKINQKYSDEITELWRSECFRLYGVLDEFSRRINKAKDNTTNV
jgi:hypothetical protein